MTTIYPSAIARACSVLDESPMFKDLPDAYLRVVIRIVKKISLNCLKKPILASRGTLSLESGKSIETVGRAVKWLEARGFIEREQKARAGLRGSSSPIRPTDALLEVLTLKGGVKEETVDGTDRKLVDKSVGKLLNTGGLSAGTPVSSDASISTKQEQSEENQLAHCVPTASSSDKPVQNPVRRNLQKKFQTPKGDVFIPAELEWMVQQGGLRATAVLKLMKFAKGQQKRLSDVVQASRKYLQELSSTSLFAYLHKLLQSNRDFSAVVQQEHQAHVQQQVKARLAQKAIDLEGRSFRTRDGKLRINVRANGCLEFIRAGILMGSSPMSHNPDFLTALDEGRLIPCANET